jgi:hypothetical protein
LPQRTAGPAIRRFTAKPLYKDLTAFCHQSSL